MVEVQTRLFRRKCDICESAHDGGCGIARNDPNSYNCRFFRRAKGLKLDWQEKFPPTKFRKAGY